MRVFIPLWNSLWKRQMLPKMYAFGRKNQRVLLCDSTQIVMGFFVKQKTYYCVSQINIMSSNFISPFLKEKYGHDVKRTYTGGCCMIALWVNLQKNKPFAHDFAKNDYFEVIFNYFGIRFWLCIDCILWSSYFCVQPSTFLFH